MKKIDTLPYINDVANRSFRDVADQDYIAARLSYRANLREPFLWSSLQAFEKYFKAILLYNNKSTKGIGHDLNKALKKVEEIKDIAFTIPDSVRTFINYLNDYGANRYLEYSTHLMSHALLELDRSVWHIRKYCFYMRGEIKKSNGSVYKLLPSNIKKVTSNEYIEYPHKYKINGGFLEKVMKKNEEPSSALVWHNFYYGKNRKKKIKKHKNHMSSANPTLTLHPEVFNELDALVHFSKEVRDHYKKIQANKKLKRT